MTGIAQQSEKPDDIRLIDILLEECARAGRDRTTKDILLRATANLGTLASVVIADDPEAIIGHAADLIIDVVDILRSHGKSAGDEALIDVVYPKSKRGDRPYTTYALGWGLRERSREALGGTMTDRVLGCLSELASLYAGPDDENYHREGRWRLQVSHNLLREGLLLITGERPGITDRELLDLIRPRVEARIGVPAASPEMRGA